MNNVSIFYKDIEIFNFTLIKPHAIMKRMTLNKIGRAVTGYEIKGGRSLLKELDCTGKNCPVPLIETKKMLESMEEGVLRTTVDNETAKENISKFAKSMHYAYSITERQGNYVVEITKGGADKTADPTATRVSDGDNTEEQTTSEKSGLVVMISKDYMGEGSEELGKILIKGYVYALTEVEPLPKAILFVNGGVRLTCEGSESLENLRALEQQGVEIMSCGTCLDFFHLKNQLAVGGVGNMYSIVELMNRAENSYQL